MFPVKKKVPVRTCFPGENDSFRHPRGKSGAIPGCDGVVAIIRQYEERQSHSRCRAAKIAAHETRPRSPPPRDFLSVCRSGRLSPGTMEERASHSGAQSSLWRVVVQLNATLTTGLPQSARMGWRLQAETISSAQIGFRAPTQCLSNPGRLVAGPWHTL